MEINYVTVKETEFPADLEVFIGKMELDFTLAVTVLGRQLSSYQVTVTIQCLLGNCLYVIEKAILNSFS